MPIGTVIEFDRYKSLGVLLSTSPGQTIQTVASFGLNSGFGPSLAASGNGLIIIEFVIPDTMTLGGVNSNALMVLDNYPGGSMYTVTTFDYIGQEMMQLGNNHNYLVGDGYSQEPPPHRIEFRPANPAGQFLNSITFSEIRNVPEPGMSVLMVLVFGIVSSRRMR